MVCSDCQEKGPPGAITDQNQRLGCFHQTSVQNQLHGAFCAQPFL